MSADEQTRHCSYIHKGEVVEVVEARATDDTDEDCESEHCTGRVDSCVVLLR
jgi:hypothetical protein